MSMTMIERRFLKKLNILEVNAESRDFLANCCLAAGDIGTLEMMDLAFSTFRSTSLHLLASASFIWKVIPFHRS